MHYGCDTLHRLCPSPVVEQIRLDQFQLRQRGLAQFAGERVRHLMGTRQRTNGAAHSVAFAQQFQHRPFSNKAGGAGNEDQTVVHQISPKECDRHH